MKKQSAQRTNAHDDQWLQYHRDNKAKEGERLEDAAKFLSGMIAISLTIFLKINDQAFASLSSNGAILIVGLWLASLALAFFVFFPFAYSYHPESVASIKAFHERMVQRKRRLLLISVICFFIALVLLGLHFTTATFQG